MRPRYSSDHSAAAKKFYRSKAWQQCRTAYIAKVHGLCEKCYDAGSDVHHIKEINHDNITDVNIILNHDNLELLCKPCHNKVTHKKPTLRNGMTIDPYTGEVTLHKIK